MDLLLEVMPMKKLVVMNEPGTYFIHIKSADIGVNYDFAASAISLKASPF